MTPPQGDDLTTALIPVACDLISAVHALDPDGVTTALGEAEQLTGDLLAAARHLAILCAAMCSEDHAPMASLGWTLNPAEYRQQLLHADALTASLRAARTAANQPGGAA